MVCGVSPGFFGKLPAVGDFVSRRLPRNFLDPWDQWLQAAIAGSKEQLGDAWLDNYLTSPVWRFSLSAGVAGPLPCTGILLPSVDKAGRYFPFTLVCFLSMDANLFQIASTAHAWYEAAETVALSVLDDEPPDVEALDSQIEALGLPVVTAVAGADCVLSESSDNRPWHIAMQSVTGLEDVFPVIVQRLAAQRFGDCSLWWSTGSEQIAPALLVCEGLPSAAGFTAMLDGGWAQHGWDDLSVPAADKESKESKESKEDKEDKEDKGKASTTAAGACP